MKTPALLLLPALAFLSLASAQVPDLVEPVVPVPENAPDLPGAPPEPIQGELPPPPNAAPEAEAAFDPLEQQKRDMAEADEGYLIKDAGLNDIFQFLAKSAGRQYFHNHKINGPDYQVTGHLNDGNPLQQMEELAFMYGLSLHMKGNTIYALNQAQIAQLPSAEFLYQLKYLRPRDETELANIKEMIKQMLSPGSGIVNYEPKTNTIVIIDTPHRIEQARRFLHGIDKTKNQIIVETKIFRVNSTAAEKMGTNWAASLGDAGVSLGIARDLQSVFGLPDNGVSGITGAGGTNLVLSPVQASGVLRALAEGGLAHQISNPTLITEDNEQATISIIDRIPIITSTTTPGTGGSPAIITEEVRYKIDTSDKAITEDPENHREIGISIVVTPTLLPDGTVRMQMRPRSAQITGEVIGQGTEDFPGNRYPRVTESMVESLARVPDGHSLVVGGFYGEVQSNDKTKVPLFGDVPVLNFFFKSKEASKEQTSLVFIVTPKSYNPASVRATLAHGNQIRSKASLNCDYDWVDPHNPGPAHEANLKRTLRGMQPHEAPFYPRAEPVAEPSGPHITPERTTPRFGRGGRK